MKLHRTELEDLLQLVNDVRADDTLGCDGCNALMDQLAEIELSGKSVPQALQAVQLHLAQCRCCRYEYEALLQAMKEVT